MRGGHLNRITARLGSKMLTTIAHVVPIKSTGINWGQALATWIPIVITLAGATVGIVRFLVKWQKTRAIRVEKLVTGLIQSFASTLNVRFEQIEQHLKDQDEETNKRFNRVDRNTNTDST